MRLFPRHQGRSSDKAFQERCKAHRILDRLRRGEHVNRWVAEWALKLTGDAA